MESIKDMNIFDFDEDFQRNKENSIQDLLKDKVIQDILTKYHQDRSIIDHNWAEFLDYQEDSHQCLNCHSLDDCHKTTKGMKQFMEIADDQIHMTLTPCVFGKELLERQKILSHILMRNVSEKLVLVTPEDIKRLSTTDENAVKKIYSYILDPKEYGFYIQGKPRIGKSTLAGFLIRNLAKNGYSCGYIHFPTFLLDLKNSFVEYGNDNNMESIRTFDYLVIDDLGGENVTPWSRDEVLSSIITYRIQNQKPTFYTSEYGKEELMKIYTLRIKDARDKIKVERLLQSIFTSSLPMVLKG